MKKLPRMLTIMVLVALLSWLGYSLIRQKWAVEKEVTTFSEAAKKLETENASIKNGITYFGRPENLLKEAQSRFNYKKEGERLLIVVPGVATTTATSTKK